MVKLDYDSVKFSTFKILIPSIINPLSPDQESQKNKIEELPIATPPIIRVHLLNIKLAHSGGGCHPPLMFFL